MVDAKPSGAFVVTQQQLRDMIVQMFDQYGVLDILRGVGIEPRTHAFLGSRDFRFQWSVMNSTNGIYNLFHGCDSIYHNDSHNQKQHTFIPSKGQSFSCLGTEINYYVQGALFRALDCTYNCAEGFCRTWKDVSGHGSLTPNCVFFLSEGYADVLLLWQKILQVENQHARDAATLKLKRMKLAVAARRKISR